MTADAFEMIGGPVHHRFQQADIDAPAGHRRGLRLHRPLDIDREGLRVVIADGDEEIVLDDEGDGRGFGLVVLAAADQVGGHEGGTILLVEAARGLDLGQFLASRNVDAKGRLDDSFPPRPWAPPGQARPQPAAPPAGPSRQIRSGSLWRFHRRRAWRLKYPVLWQRRKPSDVNRRASASPYRSGRAAGYPRPWPAGSGTPCACRNGS